MKRGERTPEAEKRRRQLHRKKQRFAELREELQLAGVLPVEPGGAFRDERVDPSTQSEQSLPALTGQAARRGWAVPEEKKPALVDELVGIIDDPEESNKVKVAAFNALRQADQSQWERDNPEKAKGGGGGFQLNVNVVAVDTATQMVEVDAVDDNKQDPEGLEEATEVPPE